MKRMLILRCYDRQRTDPDVLPAFECFDEHAFRVYRRYLRLGPANVPDLYVLSAVNGQLKIHSFGHLGALLPAVVVGYTVFKEHF